MQIKSELLMLAPSYGSSHEEPPNRYLCFSQHRSITLCLYNLSSYLLRNFQIHGMKIQLNHIKLLKNQDELILVSTAASYFNGNIYQAFSQELLTFITFMEQIFSESAVSYEAVKKNLCFGQHCSIIQ